MRPLRLAGWLPASLLVLVLATAARAERAGPVLDGWTTGTLFPYAEAGAPPVRTSVEVDHGAISFALSPDLASASVTALYQLINVGPEPEAMDVAFAFVRRDHEDDDPTAHALLELDGAPLRFRTATHVDPVAGGVHARYLIAHVDFPPHQPLTIAVHYTQQATEDRTLAVNSTYRFDHYLSTSRPWAASGPVDISVRVPSGARFSSHFPFARDADGYRFEAPALLDGDLRFEAMSELRFEAMSLGGLWLGMTQPFGYWAIFVAGLAAVAVAVGAASGQRWGRGAGGKRAGLPLLAAGALAAVSALAVLVLLLAASPPHALGAGYAGVLHGVLLAVLAGPLGAGVAWVSARAARRRRAAEAPAPRPDPDDPGPPAPTGALK